MQKKRGTKAVSLSPKQIAKARAWSKTRRVVSRLWSGKHDFEATLSLDFNMASFVYGGKKGKGGKKAMVTVSAPHFSSGKQFYWTYWPKPAEALRFGLSRNNVLPSSYASMFVGSVGTIAATLDGGCLRINAIQGAFRQAKSPELSRSLVSRHGGWRQHLLNHIFRDAVAKNIQRVALKKQATKERLTAERIETQAGIFLKAANQNGFERVKGGGKNLIEVKRKAKNNQGE